MKVLTGLAAAALVVVGGCSSSPRHLSSDPVARHLERFDQLDYEAFNKQNWELMDQIHDEDVLVTFPDGRQTRGIAQHDRDLAAMFAWAPDMRVEKHPVKLGSGEWTAVTGVIGGTFTAPMVLADGTLVPPTGRTFKVPMATFARWRGDRIIEEQLYWDTGSMMYQLGVKP